MYLGGELRVRERDTMPQPCLPGGQWQRRRRPQDRSLKQMHRDIRDDFNNKFREVYAWVA
jgi:hypothetical protein